MTTLFMLCAVVGGTVLLLQLALTLLGFIDVGADVPHDLNLDAVHAHFGDVHSADVHTGDAPSGDIAHGAQGVANWLWGIVSFRTVIAGMTFFGLFGLAMRSGNASPALQLTTATIAGAIAMYVLHAIMRGLQKVAQDNTLQIKRAIGKVGTVYLAIPPNSSGTGKVHVTVQGRLEEFEATTPSRDKLLPGAKVVVIGIVGTETLAVQLVEDAAPAERLAKTT